MLNPRPPRQRSAAFDLTGRVAVVTGGSAGIGFGIATALGRAGASVCLWARNADRLLTAQEQLDSEGITARAVQCDVTDEEAIESAMSSTEDRIGDVDILVANAGFMPVAASLGDTSVELWEAALRGNLTSTFLCFRLAAARMVAREAGGSLIAISSAASVQASPMRHHYAAAKAGLHALVRSLAVELAPAQIRCNTLVPGFTESSRLVPSALSPRRRAVIEASVPVGRIGRPADVAAAAVYLADPSLTYLTGATVFVDGGLTIMAAQDSAAAAWDQAIAAM